MYSFSTPALPGSDSTVSYTHLACEVLNEEFAKESEMGEISPILAERNLATVAIVGENKMCIRDRFLGINPLQIIFRKQEPFES